jgi:hypothetical protein
MSERDHRTKLREEAPTSLAHKVSLKSATYLNGAGRIGRESLVPFLCKKETGLLNQ